MGAFLVGTAILFFAAPEFLTPTSTAPAPTATAPAPTATAPAPTATAPAPTATAPATIDASNGYVVKAGDSCDKIARALKVRTEDLMSLNGMQSKCLIRPGQVLRIPNGAVPTATPSPTRTPVPTSTVAPTATPTATIDASNGYVVKVGDTCIEIAELLKIRLIDLRQANGLNERCLLAPGRVLKIP